MTTSISPGCVSNTCGLHYRKRPQLSLHPHLTSKRDMPKNKLDQAIDEFCLKFFDEIRICLKKIFSFTKMTNTERTFACKLCRIIHIMPDKTFSWERLREEFFWRQTAACCEICGKKDENRSAGV